MKKCFSCGETKRLKSITQNDCDCGKCDGFHNSCICKKCYFSEEISCEMESHSIQDCLTSENCPNHKDTMLRYEHWNELDYYYKPKKNIPIIKVKN